MIKFSSIFKKTLFLAHFGFIFPIFGAKKIFLENPALSHKTSYGFLVRCQNLEKFYDTIQRKCPDRRKEGQTDPISCDPSGYHRGSKNYLKRYDWLLLHHIYFHILNFTSLTISQISLYYHKTSLI